MFSRRRRRQLEVHSLSIAALSAVLIAAPARAQQVKLEGFDLNAFTPSVPVDAFFGVPSPAIGGHLVFRAAATFDYASRPFHLSVGNTITDIVAAQGFVRVDASLALWDRLLLSVDAPAAVVQSGNDPGIVGVDFHPPSSPAMGDMRFGLRGRIWGGFRDPFQVGVGSYVFVPSGSKDAYTGEGVVRAAFHGLLGGRAGGPTVGLVWSASGGAMIRDGEAPLATFGAGAGVVLGNDRLQIGPEVLGTSQIGGASRSISIAGTPVTASSVTEVEILGGAKVRIAEGLFVGAAAGTGPMATIGSPALRILTTIGWAPSPERATKPGMLDRDGDGILDDIDACPDVKGELQADPTKDGCPIADRDHDGVLDVDDACPNESGPKNPDPTKNGCPVDTDDDQIPDVVDACPKEPGVRSADRLKNGCPSDRDGDGVPDAVDACPDRFGPTSADPKQNGCPEDPDGDGIKGSADACPLEKGPPDPDPKLNGCPKRARFGDGGGEILLSTQIQFVPNGKRRSETVAPVSEALMREIKDLIDSHAEVAKIEVQGHTDDAGTEEVNQRLSQERAEAVRAWLIQAGVPADKLVAKGYGFWKPRADNRIRVGRVQNRRVEFVILEKKQ